MKKLPNFVGVANDLSELMSPELCRDELTGIRGRVKSRRYGEVECIFVAHAPIGGPLRMLVLELLPNGTWHADKEITNDEEIWDAAESLK